MIVEHLPQKATKLAHEWRASGKKVCLVPTMGYFHDGHRALMQHGRQRADKVIVSLFVNPTQFGENEDLELYPRDLEGDIASAEAAGVDLLFCPAEKSIYAEQHHTTIIVKGLSNRLCGLSRPGHFNGVATIVAKLFNMLTPDVALFGEKDYQQLVLIKTMVKDLNMPVMVHAIPTVREVDGLAMSSRNAYLNKEERSIAPVLYNALRGIRTAFHRHQKPLAAAPLLHKAQAEIGHFRQCRVEYLELFAESDLSAVELVTDRCRAAGAIKINGKVRLIDNVSMK